jgi:undecaprenyl diphosphate synthase
MTSKEKIDLHRLPRHIAIIMDGNGRWAQEQGQDRLYGHFHGVESVRNIVEGCAELNIEYLTLYAFSTENWDRPEPEVAGLMGLLVETIRKEVPILNRNNIRLHVIGDMSMLPDFARQALAEALEMTSENTGLNLVMALSYSSRWELVNAVKRILERSTCTRPSLIIRGGNGGLGKQAFRFSRKLKKARDRMGDYPSLTYHYTKTSYFALS